MKTSTIKLIECPRDAMQGWPHFIPAEKKIAYIDSLLKVGFDTIDFGSFVSPKAIPQMADTAAVLNGLKKLSSFKNSKSKLLAIVANKRGAEDAVLFDEIDYLGFPFSISETFQQRNTNSSIEESFNRVEDIQSLCIKNKKELVVYMSMGFGNPYGDPYNESVLLHWVKRMVDTDISIVSLADTVGLATPEQITSAVGILIPAYPGTEIGVHLHSTALNWKEKLEAAVNAGCRRFDGALKGIGGCPMAGDDLVGNMDTEKMIGYFDAQNMPVLLNREALINSSQIALEIFR